MTFTFWNLVAYLFVAGLVFGRRRLVAEQRAERERAEWRKRLETARYLLLVHPSRLEKARAAWKPWLSDEYAIEPGWVGGATDTMYLIDRELLGLDGLDGVQLPPTFIYADDPQRYEPERYLRTVLMQERIALTVQRPGPFINTSFS